MAIIVNGKLSDITGTAVPNGSVTVGLRNYGAQVPRHPAAALFAVLDKPIPTASDGSFSVTVPQNDQLRPANTYYIFQVADPNGDVVQLAAYQFTGPDATVDLSTLDPIDPTPLESEPLIEDLTVYVPWAAGSGTFDGLQGLAFNYQMAGNAVAPVFQNFVSGNLYTVMLVQPPAGGATFPFPSNVHGAPTDIGLAGNSTTTMVFVANDDGSLDYTGLGVVSRTP
jgi:hypothetical protein